MGEPLSTLLQQLTQKYAGPAGSPRRARPPSPESAMTPQERAAEVGWWRAYWDIGEHRDLSVVRNPEFRCVGSAWNWGDGSRLLIGPTRSGKTTAVRALCYRLQRDALAAPTDREFWLRSRIACVEAAQIVDHASVSLDRRHQRDRLRSLCAQASLLILDELGSEPPDSGRLFELLNTVAKRNRPIIATAGHRFEALRDRYGAALLVRLLGYDGRGKVVSAWGRDG